MIFHPSCGDQPDPKRIAERIRSAFDAVDKKRLREKILADPDIDIEAGPSIDGQGGTMPTVRCKYACHEITTRRHWDARKNGEKLYVAKFTPVVDGSPENAAFYEATPAGTLEIGTIKVMPFEIGKSYYLDITEAPE